MNTTSTAQYAAVAAKSSWRLACVRTASVLANNTVNTMKIPIEAYAALSVPRDEILYMLKMGVASNPNKMPAMMVFTKIRILRGANIVRLGESRSLSLTSCSVNSRCASIRDVESGQRAYIL